MDDGCDCINVVQLIDGAFVILNPPISRFVVEGLANVPVDPVGPINPCCPVDPVGPVSPVDPCCPVDPVGPVGPMKSPIITL